jgi:GNAT superfamily N-acetyltransferase
LVKIFHHSFYNQEIYTEDNRKNYLKTFYNYIFELYKFNKLGGPLRLVITEQLERPQDFLYLLTKNEYNLKLKFLRLDHGFKKLQKNYQKQIGKSKKSVIYYIEKNILDIIKSKIIMYRKIKNFSLLYDIVFKLDNIWGVLPEHIIYITDGKELISIIGFRIEKYYSYLQGIITTKKYRGIGYGTVILNSYYNFLKKKNIMFIVLKPLKGAMYFWKHKQYYEWIPNSVNMIRSLYKEKKFLRYNIEKEDIYRKYKNIIDKKRFLEMDIYSNIKP